MTDLQKKAIGRIIHMITSARDHVVAVRELIADDQHGLWEHLEKADQDIINAEDWLRALLSERS